MLTKQQILSLVNEWPHNEVDVDALMEKLYLLERLEKAEADVKEGRLHSNEQVKQMIESWRQSPGQNLPKAI